MASFFFLRLRRSVYISLVVWTSAWPRKSFAVSSSKLDSNRIVAWGLMTWSKCEQSLCGRASLDLLGKLKTEIRLPPDMEMERQHLKLKHSAIEWQRVLADPSPLLNILSSRRCSSTKSEARTWLFCLLMRSTAWAYSSHGSSCIPGVDSASYLKWGRVRL